MSYYLILVSLLSLLLATPSAGDVSSLITRNLFEAMLPRRNDIECPAWGFYTYDAFIEATKSFTTFGNTGDIDTRKRELAAFFAQTSHETRGKLVFPIGGNYTWGYCIKEGSSTDDYCVLDPAWPCCEGKKYYGRGPIQLKYNYEYGPCGDALGLDLLCNPELVANNANISFQSAIWFWMIPRQGKPSCHDVMVGHWKPSCKDVIGHRFPGFGVTTNIINGTAECGHGYDRYQQDRIGYYKRYCDLLGVSYGDNIDCCNQTPFGSILVDPHRVATQPASRLDACMDAIFNPIKKVAG